MEPCKVCGEPFVKMADAWEETCVGFFSPPGHDHDDNCFRRTVRCANDHAFDVSLKRKCPVEGCDWKSKDECWCHDGKKLDAWPDLPTYPLFGGA